VRFHSSSLDTGETTLKNKANVSVCGTMLSGFTPEVNTRRQGLAGRTDSNVVIVIVSVSGGSNTVADQRAAFACQTGRETFCETLHCYDQSEKTFNV
jgi:hypothetical protein